MHTGRRVLALALAGAAVAATVTTVPVTASADATTTLTGNQVAATSDGEYKIQNNAWGDSSAGSVTTDLGEDFTVASSYKSPDLAAGEPGGFPSIYQGCDFGNCSGGALANHPVRDGTGVTASLDTTQPDGSGSTYNTALETLFNSTPTTSGRGDCAELMVWLNKTGSVHPAGDQTGTATIDGTSYDVWYQPGSSTISYSMTSPATSVSDVNIGDLEKDAVRRGYMARSCYLIAVEGGFEVWQGGKGLATNSFSVNVNGS
jgi:hypothetical protein